MTAAPRFDASIVAAALGVQDVQLLGTGAFGDTWKVGDEAVKIIAADNYRAERITREVEGLSRVNSAYVVRLLKTEEVDLGGKSRAALFFEYVEGGDVESRITNGRWPTDAELIAFTRALLQGVSDIHETRTVHRDLKPANVALRCSNWDRPVILDLGLARGMEDSTITVYPGLLGTPAYMAPEQLRGDRARKAADLFAVGVIARQLAGQKHPFFPHGLPPYAHEAIQRIEEGPSPIEAVLSDEFKELLDRLVSPREHDRGSAESSLRRMRNV